MRVPVRKLDALCAELEATWHREIPVSRAMAIRIHSRTSSELVVSAGLAENINVHGTAFAGSLYSVCVLTAWGSAWLALEQGRRRGQIVARKAEIDYLRPVTEEIKCRCVLADDTRREALADFDATGRARLELVAEIESAERAAVRFAGRFVLSRV